MKINCSFLYLFYFFSCNFLLGQTAQGDALMEIMQYDKAIQAYQKDRDSIRFLKLSYAYERKEDLSNAIQNMHVYLENVQSKLTSWIRIAKLYQKNNQSVLAIPYMELAVKENPTEFTWYELGFLHEENSNLLKALDCYYQGIKLNTFHTLSNYRCGLILSQMQKYDNALIYVDNGLRNNSKHLPSLLLKIQLLYYTDKTKSCVELIESIQSEFSLNEKIKVIYAKALTKLGNYEKSIQVYQEILAKTTDENPDILLQIGLNYGFLNQTKQAEKWILESLQSRFYSKHVEYYYLGQFLQPTNASKAKSYYEKALIEKKDFFQADYALLLLQLETKSKKDQLVLLEKFISKYPEMSNEIKAYCQQKIKQLKTDIHFE